MLHVIKKKKKRGLWPKLAIRHGQVLVFQFQQNASAARRYNLAQCQHRRVTGALQDVSRQFLHHAGPFLMWPDAT